MLGLARPVRIDPKSSPATETAFSIFSSASKSVSSITFISRWVAGACRGRAGSGVRADDRADLLTVHGTGDVALFGQVEDHDRHPVVAAEADRGGVRDLEPTGQELVVGDRVEAHRRRVGLRVGV